MRIHEHPDAIVIGSGFGGAVSAARLAEAGVRVLVLERGPWWGKRSWQSSIRRRPFPRGVFGLRKALRGVRWARGRKSRSVLINRDGLLEMNIFERLNALVASGVGGGSLIYGDVQAQADDEFFDYFPPEISADELRPYYERVRTVLQPTPFPAVPIRSAVLEAAAAASHLHYNHADLAVAWRTDRGTGQPLPSTSFLLGSETGGKRSLDKTYIPLALGAGADLQAMCEVVAIERTGTGYRVRWIDHAERTNGSAEARIVIVSAGTLGTLRLLFAARDRDKSLDLPASLGRHFSTGGDVAATLHDTDAQDSPYGPSPGSGVAFTRDGHHHFYIVESGMPGDSLPLPAPLRRRWARSVGLAGMGRENSQGVVAFDGQELRTDTSRALDAEYFAAIEAAMSSLADKYHPRRMTFERGENATLTTVHPMGGAVIANTPEEGVVDHTGQVFGNPGLYVSDASILPHAPGWPPSMTIAALAERQAQLLIDGARSHALHAVAH